MLKLKDFKRNEITKHESKLIGGVDYFATRIEHDQQTGITDSGNHDNNVDTYWRLDSLTPSSPTGQG
jgi:hypothetical protein